jgi:hypothetical protein
MEAVETAEIVVVKASEFGLEEIKVLAIAEKFKPVISIMAEYEAEFQEVITLDISDPKTAVKASALRKKYAKVRTATGHLHKQEKADSLALGRYIDKWKNEQEKVSERIESKLEAIEKHAENLEKERIADLQKERETELAPFEVENVTALRLGEMPANVWVNFFNGTKQAFIEKKEEALRLENERIVREQEEIKERERVRLENEKLKQEAEAREAELKKQREEFEAKLREENEKTEAKNQLRKQREAILWKFGYRHDEDISDMPENDFERLVLEEEAAFNEAEKKRIEAEQEEAEAREKREAELKAEREERLRIEIELREKNEREAREKREAEEKVEAEASRGDKDKWLALISDLEALQTKYTFRGKNNRSIQGEVNLLLNKVISHVTAKTK